MKDSEILNLDREKSRLRALIRFIEVGVLVYILFWVLSGICFGIVDAVLHLKKSSVGVLSCRWKNFFLYPWYVFELYHDWWLLLLKSIRQMNILWILFVPFVVPLGVVLSLINTFFSRKYFFRFWFFLNHGFAKIKDIERMGLNKGVFMVLGRFAEVVLGARPAESVLCIGEMGTGKTSSVAIPSVLRSDNACMIAVDMTGLLPKYTAGHRAELGKIFYYNWDLLDDPQSGFFYPRWNPLAAENMPKDQPGREAYLRRIAGYLADIDEKEKDNYWNLLTHSIISSFLIYWTTKIAQAQANDYFLSKLLEGKHLNKEEKDVLLSYYIQMPQSYFEKAMQLLENNQLTVDNYMPIGSWGGVLEQWCGREPCFASITDWLIYCYMKMKDEQGKDWKSWIVSLIKEAVLFGYGKGVVDGLKQFSELSARQRQIAFACVLRPFRIFTNQALRERTDGNDFNLKDIRGVYDEKLKNWVPVTVYSLANTYSSKILNQMFLDEVLYRSLYMTESQGPLPMMFVLDDVGHNLKLNHLAAMTEAGKHKKISALLLCNNLSLVENTYGKEELETIVVNTSYKVIKAPDNQQLSRQLDKLATFATKSVQIPRTKKHKFRGSKVWADANYFHRLALDFKSCKNIKVNIKDYQLVLAEGYYNRPILANSIYFAEDEKFRALAVLDAEYTLTQDVLKKDNPFARETPKIVAVFDQSDLGLDSGVGVDQYMNAIFEEVLPEIKNAALSKKETNMQIPQKQKDEKKDNDWWMKEEAFRFEQKMSNNPFKRQG